MHAHISLIFPYEFLRFIVYTIAYHTRLGAVGRRAYSTTKATHKYMTDEGAKSLNPRLINTYVGIVSIYTASELQNSFEMILIVFFSFRILA